ncbi:hypothetical protein ZIOFF_050360 [Zingiber officinale]|uniref:Uncharacterized protein n=1 Tax=Zingiber officinale TaxID=94328 RepID=A0A8J5FGQ3_ZINOF|nr:hypothetical protein ZIOFF_050360 [Zingiber officinale]
MKVCINDALTDDELRAVLSRLEKEEERDLFGLVCKRWLRLQSSERRRLRARAGPAMLRQMADRFQGIVELDLSQSASRSFYPGVTDSDLAVIAAGFRALRVLDLQNCKDYDEALANTEEISSPAIGFIVAKDAPNKDINRQNNTIINLLLKVNKKLDQLFAKPVSSNSEQVASLAKQLEGLTLGKAKEVKREPFYLKEWIKNLRKQLNPEAELELSQRRRASLVPAETLYSTNWNAGVNALIVLRDTRWRDDRSIIGTMEVDLSGEYGYPDTNNRWDTLGEPSGKYNYYVNYAAPSPQPFIPATRPSWGDEDEDNTDDDAIFPSIWEDTPWEEDPDLDPNDLAPANEDEEDLESYFLGLSNLETDYPVISPNSVLPDDNLQLPSYWDNSDTESEEYWQQVVEEVEQVEEQFYATQTIIFQKK